VGVGDNKKEARFAAAVGTQKPDISQFETEISQFETEISQFETEISQCLKLRFLSV